MNRNHTTSLEFLGAVGNVTPSSTILTHTFGKRTIRIMVDAGITPGSKERIIMPTGIDILFLSHGHVDHVGQLPFYFMQNPESRIYIPEGNGRIIAHNVLQSYRLSREENPETKMGRWLDNARGLLHDVEKNIPKQGIKRGRGGRTAPSRDRRQMLDDISAQEGNLDSAILQLCMLLGISDGKIGHLNYKEMIVFFQKEIQITYANMLDALKHQGVVTKGDVDRSLAALQELSLEKWHKIMSIEHRHIRARFDPTGHIVTGPGCSVGIELPTPNGSKKTIGFSGDIGNPTLGYPGTNPDRRHLFNLFDTMVSESTYGGKEHPDRADALRKLDAEIMHAVREKTDIVVITLALERPIYSLYEILQGLKNNGIDPNSLDISYFGDSIADVFKFFPKGEIKSTVGPFLKPLLPAGLTREGNNAFLSKLGRPGKKQRLIITSCGFFHPDGPSAALLKNMYPQPKLLIVSPNFHGEPDSNGDNLFNGKPYQIGPDIYHPRAGHRTFKAGGFSGHADSDGLARTCRKMIKPKGGTIFLNHGSDEARETLAEKLRSDPVIISKGAKVVLPKSNRPYKV